MSKSRRIKKTLKSRGLKLIAVPTASASASTQHYNTPEDFNTKFYSARAKAKARNFAYNYAHGQQQIGMINEPRPTIPAKAPVYLAGALEEKKEDTRKESTPKPKPKYKMARKTPKTKESG